MADNLKLSNDFTTVIKTLTEELSFLRSEVRLLRDSLYSQKDDKAPEVQEWLTLEQLMTYIPGSPSIPTLRRWIKQDGLPAQKVKRKLVFLKSGIDEWLRKRSVSSDFEIEQKAKDYLKSTVKTHIPPWRQKKSVS